jgi:hypothetical protein
MSTDARTREDAVVVSWTGEQRGRRLVFEPRDVGGWLRVEQRHDGDAWREVGQEIVANLRVENAEDL